MGFPHSKTASSDDVSAVIIELERRGHRVVRTRRDRNRLEVDGIVVPPIRHDDTIHQSVTAIATEVRQRIGAIELANRTRQAIVGD